MKNEITQILNELSQAINAYYGYVTLEGSNYGEPAINSGPCGPFANVLLYDGGVGVHDENYYDSRFKIEDMKVYDYQLLDQRSYGLNRAYPRFCPNFNLDELKTLIIKYLDNSQLCKPV
jgi:hypothetical protein